MANVEQQRAAFALDHVYGVRGTPPAEKYLIELRKLPARLHTSGLGQTVAFYLSSGPGSPEAAICDWVGSWLRTKQIYSHQGGLIDAIAADADGERYRRASAEARALAVWLKRFAEAFLTSAAASTSAGAQV